jgi:hypothetical protein
MQLKKFKKQNPQFIVPENIAFEDGRKDSEHLVLYVVLHTRKRYNFFHVDKASK